ncbi:MAG TPA: hypothetical protein VHW23_03675 [Kofleriaceae bacterium]|jgi:hypothetical protein|nr:hypothetical protein [Kofleriaceae bacterium]
MMRSLLAMSLLFAGCTATVAAGPAHSAPPPPPPPPAPVAMQAPPPPPPSNHPAYLHALTDLRNARAFLERPANVVVKWDEKRAIREIDAAIHEIKQAAIDDGKDISVHEPVDRPTWGARLQRTQELLAKARADISEEEDSPSSKVHALRGRALGHIANAEQAVRDGMEDARAMAEPPPPPPPPPATHPAYLHALSDLRMARALLQRPARDAEVKWDENRAIAKLDAAYREIKDAAIDDGKPIEDHPPIDAHLRHRDRIRAAIDMLDKAAHDIEEREDNGFARGLRGRAVGHIRDAVRFSREAIEDRRH